jgi:hypothetical protein
MNRDLNQLKAKMYFPLVSVNLSCQVCKHISEAVLMTHFLKSHLKKINVNFQTTNIRKQKEGNKK